MKNKSTLLDFVIDRLTNSVRNTISGDSFTTEVLRLTNADLKGITKKAGWNFNWKAELADNTREVFKLTITNNPRIIQGLLSLSIEPDHVYMHLLENAPFNTGHGKLYEGVAGNLVAHACKVSFQQGFDGFVAFTAKTKLIAHYQKTLGASILSGQRMIIPTGSAQILVNKYFKS
ncbi:MAG: hypothetical protein LH606_12680 [Cytophagaceae bacterium]|nr:hypothetical protein [Cytophagaceae bacterium]